MRALTRRALLSGAGGLVLGGTAVAGYGVGVETPLVTVVTRYAFTPPRWPADLSLRVAIIADIHACEPWMPAERVREIAEIANALKPDLTLLLGDFNAGHRIVTAPVLPAQWADALRVLEAPLGVYAILGNHDWWHGPLPGMRGGPDEVRHALASINIREFGNAGVSLSKDGRRFWLLGLGDQMAHWRGGRWYRGADDLEGTLRLVTDDAPILLMAHEPFVFSRVPPRVSLTLSGHTHGGQVNLPIIGAPLSPGRDGHRYVYGHIVEDGRHLLISGGLGTSIFPVRIGRPPEVVDLRLGPEPPATV